MRVIGLFPLASRTAAPLGCQLAVLVPKADHECGELCLSVERVSFGGGPVKFLIGDQHDFKALPVGQMAIVAQLGHQRARLMEWDKIFRDRRLKCVPFDLVYSGAIIQDRLPGVMGALAIAFQIIDWN